MKGSNAGVMRILVVEDEAAIGKQLYQCIKDRYPKLIKRVIFTSGDVVNNHTQHFLEQSGRPFLSKPFTPEELITAVREAFKPTAVK